MARARDGSFEWLRKANSRDDREERRQIAAATRAVLEKQAYELESGVVSLKHMVKMVEGTRLISPTLGQWPLAAAEVDQPLPVPKDWTASTALSFVRATVLDTAVEKVLAGRRVVVVNAASAYQSGGGFKGGGRHALEESMCVQSTLYKSLEKVGALAKRAGVQPPPWALPRQQRGGRPWDMHIPEDGAALSPFVEVFRKGTHEGYVFSSLATLDAIVSVAMPNCNAKVRDSPIDAQVAASEGAAPEWERGDEPTDAVRDPSTPAYADAPYVAQLERKWRAALAAAAYYTEADCLIVPDAGCGVFANPPETVGAAFGRVLRNEFAGRFVDVLLASKSGSNGEQFAESAQKSFEAGDLVHSRSSMLPSVS